MREVQQCFKRIIAPPFIQKVFNIKSKKLKRTADYFIRVHLTQHFTSTANLKINFYEPQTTHYDWIFADHKSLHRHDRVEGQEVH